MNENESVGLPISTEFNADFAGLLGLGILKP